MRKGEWAAVAMILASLSSEAGGALPDSVDGKGRPQSTRATRLGALMDKFSSATTTRHGSSSAAQREMRWPRRIMVTGGMQNVHPDDGIDPDGDIPIAYEKLCTVTAESIPVPDEDCIVDEWTIAPSLSMGKRCLHSSSQLGGRVLVLGGHNGYTCLGTVEAFDPSTSTWVRDIPTMSSLRVGLASAVLNSRVYALGGCSAGFTHAVETVESWCEGEAAWRREPPMPVARNRHAAVALNGRLYVLGGHDGADSLASVHSYDPETMEWREEAPMSTERHAVAAAVSGGRIYAVGGYAGLNEDEEEGLVPRRLDTVESYDPSENKWRDEARMTMARSGHVAIGTEGNQVIVAGGCLDGGNTRTGAVEVLDCGEGGCWKAGAPMLMERFGCAASLLPEY